MECRVESPKYEANRKIGTVEIWRYPKMVDAKVEKLELDAFDLLYKFITGNNRQKTQFRITTPVVSQQITMTSPVLSHSARIYETVLDVMLNNLSQTFNLFFANSEVVIARETP